LKAAIVNAVVIGTGGFLGAVARYGLSGVIHRGFSLKTFPYGTLVVNLLGCFAIGVLAGLVESRHLFGPDFRRFAMIGILGGFTTFSTFGYETFALIRDADFLRAAANIGLHVVLGVLLLALGYAIAALR
jgi:CrcB protein